MAYLVMVGRVDPQTSLQAFAEGLRCAICNSRRVTVAIEGAAIALRRAIT